MANFCPKCGGQMNPNAKFCNKCGHAIGTPSGGKQKKSKSGNNTGTIIAIVAIIAVLAMVFLAIVGFVVFKSGALSRLGIGKKPDTTMETQQQEQQETQEQENGYVPEESEEEAEDGGDFGEESVDDGVARELVGVSPDNVGDYENCTSPDDYLIEYVNSEFSFGYPKDFFSDVEIQGNTYKFRTADGSTRMTVCQEQAVSNDAIENCRYYHNRELANVDTSSEVSGVNNISDHLKDGWAHSLIGGNVNGSNESVYRIVVSNGANVYSLTFEYIDQNPNNYYTAQMYMIDCVYRLCEHSGTSYYVRNYLQFLDDEMGTKK